MDKKTEMKASMAKVIVESATVGSENKLESGITSIYGRSIDGGYKFKIEENGDNFELSITDDKNNPVDFSEFGDAIGKDADLLIALAAEFITKSTANNEQLDDQDDDQDSDPENIELFDKIDESEKSFSKQPRDAFDNDSDGTGYKHRVACTAEYRGYTYKVIERRNDFKLNIYDRNGERVFWDKQEFGSDVFTELFKKLDDRAKKIIDAHIGSINESDSNGKDFCIDSKLYGLSLNGSLMIYVSGTIPESWEAQENYDSYEHPAITEYCEELADEFEQKGFASASHVSASYDYTVNYDNHTFFCVVEFGPFDQEQLDEFVEYAESEGYSKVSI